MATDYIVVKIDTERMDGGADVAKSLRGDGGGGIPWIVILDADRKALITSDGPGGNIGCPVTPEERAHFIAMLEKTAQRIGAERLAELKKALDEFAEKILAARR